MTTYRLIAINDGIEHSAGTIDTLFVSPEALLVVRVPEDTDYAEHARIRLCLEQAFKGVRTLIVRGDVQFFRLMPAEILP